MVVTLTMPKKRMFIQFGSEVRRRRLEMNLTLEQLAERAGLTSNYIGTIEHGTRDPSLSSIQAIARGFGIPVGLLFGPMRTLSPASIEMGKLFDTVSVDVQTAVLQILRSVREALGKE